MSGGGGGIGGGAFFSKIEDIHFSCIDFHVGGGGIGGGGDRGGGGIGGGGVFFFKNRRQSFVSIFMLGVGGGG